MDSIKHDPRRRALLISATTATGFVAAASEAAFAEGAESAGMDKGAVGRSIQAKASNWINVKDFGAVGDGVNDDTKAMQAAAYSLKSGGILFIPTGTYLVTQVRILSNTWVLGSGGGSVLKSVSHLPARGIITNADHAAGNEQLHVSNLTIRRTEVVAGEFNDHIYFRNSSFIRIEDTTHIGAATGEGSNKGITLEGCQHGWIVGNYCKNIADNCIAVNWNGSRQSGFHTIANNTTEVGAWTHSHVLATSDHTTIVDNRFIGGTFGVELGNDVDSVAVRGNEAIACGMFISPSGTNFEISENTALDPARGSIYVNSAFGMTRGHAIRNNHVATIYCNGSAFEFGNVLIEGNHVHGASSGSGSGIVVQNVDNAIIRNNYATGHTRFGIHFQTTRNAIVEGNVCSGNASHGIEMDLGSARHSAIIRNNVCYGNAGLGYKLEQPQNWSFMDNEGWDNRSGLINVANASSKGTIPLQNVRLRGAGVPSFHGSPGSTYHRTDGGAGTSFYVKESESASLGGWVGVGKVT